MDLHKLFNMISSIVLNFKVFAFGFSSDMVSSIKSFSRNHIISGTEFGPVSFTNYVTYLHKKLLKIIVAIDTTIVFGKQRYGGQS